MGMGRQGVEKEGETRRKKKSKSSRRRKGENGWERKERVMGRCSEGGEIKKSFLHASTFSL